MALDPKKRQKQLAKKTAKRKAARKAHTSPTGSASLMREALLASKSPIHECLVPKGLFEAGIGNLIISRKMPGGDIATGVFLLDVFCLGVKNAFFRVFSDYEYEHTFKADLIDFGPEDFEPMEPTCMRKLIQQAVAYAQDLGFKPHADYTLARILFGDADPNACPQVFTFGSSGKPSYIAGPNDSPTMARHILKTLERHCGPGGYDFVVNI